MTPSSARSWSRTRLLIALLWAGIVFLTAAWAEWRLGVAAVCLLALVDALQDGTLNEDQRETVHALRLGILTLVEREGAAMD